MLPNEQVLSGEVLTEEPYSGSVLKNDQQDEVLTFSNYSKRLSQSGKMSDNVRLEDLDRVSLVFLKLYSFQG